MPTDGQHSWRSWLRRHNRRAREHDPSPPGWQVQAAALPNRKRFEYPEGGGIDNDIDILTYICVHKFYSSNFHFPVRAQAAAARAVPGRDLAGKKVHEDYALQDDDDEEEEVVVHKRQDRKRKGELIPLRIS